MEEGEGDVADLTQVWMGDDVGDDNNAEETEGRIVAPRQYAQIMFKFLEFLGEMVTIEQVTAKQIDPHILLRIQPEDVVRYFNMKAYGKMYPGTDDVPTLCRSSTLTVYKKAVSFFCPRTTMAWDEIAGMGNPTRSKLVNNLVKKVKRHEVRHEGVRSRARRPIEWQEYIKLQEKLCIAVATSNHSTEKKKYLMARSLFCMQWHMISRVDDMCHLSFENITNNPSFPFALCLKFR